jgi:hypothetical protein
MSTRYLTRRLAADHLTARAEGRQFTVQALADMASDGEGPPYAIVRGRALYRVEDLERFLAEQFEQPTRRGRRHRTERAQERAAP